jgi:hypothetical protein
MADSQLLSSKADYQLSTNAVLLQSSQVAMHGSRPPLAPPVERGEDRLPASGGGTEGGRVANHECFTKSAKVLKVLHKWRPERLD